jgi:uncharacterized protein (UPF0262 family)
VSDQPRIAKISFDERSIARRGAQFEHERKVAIHDLLEDNYFAPTGDFRGPFNLRLSVVENHLVFDVRDQADAKLTEFTLSLSSFHSIIKDYFIVCDSYFAAIKTSPPSKIEALDMGRRSLHDEGGEMLIGRLAGKLDIDQETARRLFTLICVLRAGL